MIEIVDVCRNLAFPLLEWEVRDRTPAVVAKLNCFKSAGAEQFYSRKTILKIMVLSACKVWLHDELPLIGPNVGLLLRWVKSVLSKA